MVNPLLFGIVTNRDLEAVQVTPCTLRVRQIWGYHSMAEGHVLVEYLGMGADVVHV